MLDGLTLFLGELGVHGGVGYTVFGLSEGISICVATIFTSGVSGKSESASSVTLEKVIGEALGLDSHGGQW